MARAYRLGPRNFFRVCVSDQQIPKETAFMLARIFGYLKALFGIKLDNLEDPEVLLKQAQDEMQAAHEKNRQLAIEAITQKNQLQAEIDKTTKQVENLQAKAEMALKNGNKDLALQLLREKQQLEGTLTTLNTSMQSALERTEQIKVAMRREEEAIRTRAAQAMAMKTQWKQAQIENSINKAFDKMSSISHDEAFDRAQAKITKLQSEGAARSEMSSTRIESQIAALDDSVADSNAAKELAEMEARLSGGTTAATTTATTTETLAASAATPGSAEAELAALEQKVGGAGGTAAAP